MFYRQAVLVVLGAFLPSLAHAAPEVPGKKQDQPIALVGGTVFPVSGPPLEGATVLFADGKVTAIGKDLKLPSGTERIDITGKHVYPGLFDPFSTLGLIEILAVRATRDQIETGQINPNARSQIAFNPDSELIPVARSNGVLTVLCAPSGGLVSGTSAVMQLDGWTWEEMTLHGSAGVHIRWPLSRPATEERPNDNEPPPQDRNQGLASLRQAFADARAYLKAKSAPASPGTLPVRFDARWEAMIPVLEGTLPIIVAADRIGQIQEAVAFASKEEVRMILLGGYDAPYCAELLKKHAVPVILTRVNRLPLRKSDAYDDPFTVARRLHEAGVSFCISGGEEPAHVRNLPYHAATAAAFGLPKDEALKAITLYPARILGVEHRIGSLESGKDATLIVTTGDVLEIASRVEMAFIQGRKLDLSDRQKRLWEKYQEKYRRIGAERAAAGSGN